ncbi:hypothetical protein A2U01_0098874, partial [Trifolium medium]|nr:hypothetical protein [Trifolium medium]
NNHSLASVGSYCPSNIGGFIRQNSRKTGFPLEPEAELPVQAEAEVELVVVQFSAAARHASSPYDAFRPAPVVL